MNSILDNNTFIIDEKLAIRRDQYTITNADAQVIGQVKENHGMLHYLIRRFFIPMPSTLSLFDNNGHLVASLHEGWNFINPKVSLTNERGKIVAHTKFLLKFRHQEISIFDTKKCHIATIHGDWKNLEFAINDAEGRPIGSASKTDKKIFTYADQFIVNINPEVKDEVMRMVVVMSAFMICVVIKESR